jgi:hypothetical protein
VSWSSGRSTTPADHTHAGAGSGGQLSHDSALTGVSANDHHAEAHTHPQSEITDLTTDLAGAEEIILQWQSKASPTVEAGSSTFLPKAGTFVSARAYQTGAVTATATLDVLLNGSSIFGANPKPTVTSGNENGALITTFATTTFAAADKLVIDVVATGNATKKLGIVITVRY